MKRFLFLTIIYAATFCFSMFLLNASAENSGLIADENILKTNDEDKKCVDCHSEIIGKEQVHYPASESCEDCHVKNDQPHPSAGIKGFSLTEEGSALCLMCHDNVNTKKNIHYPIEDGDCVQCHSPHSSDYSHLLTKSPISNLCIDCHDAEKIENKKVHEPYKQGECSKCHDPHQSNFRVFLKKETSDLCLSCHKTTGEEMKKENIHAPAEEDCLNCHKAHVSNYKYLLDEKVSDNCYTCHDKLNTKRLVHVPVQEGECNVCHSPHGSSEKKFLISAEEDLCLSCHEETIWKNYKKKEQAQKNLNIHAAIELGGCSSCHNPHSTDKNSLLIKNFPDGLYAAAEVDNFEMCFDCHDSDMLKEDSKNSTDFRNGEQNLHYLHINGEKGRNCNSCHDMHSSTNVHLILNKVLFGKWEMQMKYESTENGGSCNTGCHAKKEYVR